MGERKELRLHFYGFMYTRMPENATSWGLEKLILNYTKNMVQMVIKLRTNKI